MCNLRSKILRVSAMPQHPILEHYTIYTTGTRTARESRCHFGNILLVAVDWRRFKTLRPTRMQVKILFTWNPRLRMLFTKHLNHRTAGLRALIIGLE
jgi:hypothetical protein